MGQYLPKTSTKKKKILPIFFDIFSLLHAHFWKKQEDKKTILKNNLIFEYLCIAEKKTIARKIWFLFIEIYCKGTPLNVAPSQIINLMCGWLTDWANCWHRQKQLRELRSFKLFVRIFILSVCLSHAFFPASLIDLDDALLRKFREVHNYFVSQQCFTFCVYQN